MIRSSCLDGEADDWKNTSLKLCFEDRKRNLGGKEDFGLVFVAGSEPGVEKNIAYFGGLNLMRY